ncbi:Cna B-type domain-containing protein [Spirosoma foliorum]|uniref:Cna B-type domain-containing protein n=1 Tax=Spirosoma foliorum TaxID=2710596 RepID=A0A7G5GQH2_9BACT|nr:Cna B-type domain-containing protein [Spirosoma foliorum]
MGQTITGTVYRDFNSDGVYASIPASGTYSYGEPGVGGVTITAYNAAGAAIATTTSSTVAASLGTYTLTVGNTGPYRVEFVNLPTGYFDGPRGTGSGTSVQFVASSPASNVNLGINYPTDYCQAAPNFLVPCYVNGDPLGGGSSGTQGVLVTLPYNSTGDSPAEFAIATNAQIGTVFGVAYQRTSKVLFTSAFVKRHSGLGTGGAGAIYITKPGSGTTYSSALFTTLPTATTAVALSATTGGSTVTVSTTVGSNVARGLPAATTTLNHDPSAFDQVGKAGLGDIEISEDGTQLYAVNLGDRRLYQIPIINPTSLSPSAGTPTSFSLPAVTQATGSVLRPFALKVYRGRVYVGAVTTNEAVSTTVSAGTGSTGGSTPMITRDPSSMVAYVFEFNPVNSSFTTVLSFPLSYTKGASDNDQTGVSRADRWYPWTDVQAATGLIPNRYARNSGSFSYPQPMLTGIEFDVDGSMILSIRDRFGDQYGNNNLGTNVSDNSSLFRAISPGDILRAGQCTPGVNQWTIENNARICSGTATLGANTNQGPGGGEYYYSDGIAIPSIANPYHAEMSEGGLALFPGRDEVASIVLDPTSNVDSGGIRRFKNSDGSGSPSTSVQIYYSGDVATYGKANGLGDVELNCDEPPIQIGNRVWIDSNNNGIQDPGEAPLAGIQVTLTGPGITGSVSVTTNAAGEYYFSSAISSTAATGFAYNLTGLTAGSSYSLTFPTSASAGALTLSGKPDSATGTNSDHIDTDPNTAGVVSFTLGQAGQNNFSYDAGYVPPASLGDYVFVDANKNGIQDTGDTPIQGVKVTLYTNGVASATTVTNASGLYSFTGLTPSTSISYAVGFDTPTGYTATTPLSGTDKSKDSDPVNGITAPVNLTAGENNITLDAGFYLIPARLGDYVFLDANKDGIQNTGDTPIQGVTAILYINGVASATTVTNASGFYSFTGLTPGSSLSYSVGFTAPAGYTATLANQGTDDTKDSDADPITGITQSVTLSPAEFNPTLDAGYYIPTAGLGDYVFLDANNDGIQNTGDTPIQGVTVTLYTNGVASATTVTNASGFYSFTGLTPGSSLSYSVGFTTPSGYTPTLANAGNDDTLDSDADPITGRTQSVTLAPSEFNPTLDAGFAIPSAELGDYVFLDVNKDGIQDADDSPIQGVTVTLYINGVASATTVTNVDGLYSFTGLTPGNSFSYSVGFTAPAGYTATLANAGTDDELDSDADPITGRTQSVTLAPGEFNPTLDAGYYIPTAGLGDYVFLDANKDGIQNTGDTPIQGVTVILYTNGVASATTVTNASGLYSFTGLTPGSSLSYSVGFTTPAGYTATTPLSGTNKATDSDADLVTGRTASVTLAPGEFNPTLDAGYYILQTTLELDKFVDKSKAKLGDILTYAVVITNTGSTTATNVVVTDSSTTGLTYNPTSVTAPTGTTFSLGTPNSTWTIPSLSPGQSLSLIIQARVDSAGILYNKAYIPGDTATVCSSIPFVMCAGDSYAFTLTAPTGRSSYKWYKDNVEIVGQTTNVLEVTAPGTYSLAVDNVTGKCPDFSCCPFIVEEDSLPTFQALATPVTCVANTPQANGQITLSGFKAAYTYQYSLGSTFNQAASLSGAAKAIPAGGVIVSNLVNPAVAQAYTVRVYNASGCYTDVTVMLMPTVCGCPADVCVPYVITQSKRAKRIGDPR